MSANGLKIGVVGGYVSGKATFLNALLKTPCFPMRSTGHNHSIVEIHRAVDETSSWDSMDSEDRRWLRSLENIREGNGHLRIRTNIPCFLWGDAVFYDFPQISDILAWKREYLSFVEKMDLIVTLFDAEYVMALANQKIMDCLVPLEKKIAVILNKCEIVDDIADLSAQARQVFTNDDANLPIFTVSSELELLRWTSPKERQMSFAFTESRRNVMMICDLSFSSFRTWLYESIVSSEHTDREVKYAD